MPALPNVRQEAFAQARAKGAGLEDAYEDAGYTPCHRNASHMAARPEVAERIAELRAEREITPKRLDHDTVISFLMHNYVEWKDTSDPRIMKEARIGLLEALRVTNEKNSLRALDRERLKAGLEKPENSEG